MWSSRLALRPAFQFDGRNGEVQSVLATQRQQIEIHRGRQPIVGPVTALGRANHRREAERRRGSGRCATEGGTVTTPAQKGDSPSRRHTGQLPVQFAAVVERIERQSVHGPAPKLKTQSAFRLATIFVAVPPPAFAKMASRVGLSILDPIKPAEAS